MTDEPDITEEHQTERRPFAVCLYEMRKGGLHTEMSDELANLVVEVVKTGKKGSITLTLDVALMSDGVTVAVSDTIKLKTPRFDTAATMYWSDDVGNLHRERPDQQRLPLREVAGGLAMDPETGAVRIREVGD